ncbi:GTPase [Methanosarcina sp. Z-7115]|uniref:GTPase n=1 Tax=Methanosarcina baikalica TaxID=3073890 RepID=A0ABU2D1V0_9EURY|nr:GTPase [Methanosarcina sp. Z-7115]MDR7665959.1 GTPase [Methanosarcina sp. Z-7115]
MTSYKVLVRDVIKKADVLLEVIDARFPEETRNSEIEREIVRLNKPFIIVINKCDLVSNEKLEKTKTRLSKIAPTIFISSKDRSGTTMLRHQILASARIKDRDILVGTLGYPNVGKSSVINGVTGRHRTGTSPISGYTKGVQNVDAGSRIMFIDTPGVIPFDENDEYIQGLLGIKDATHLKDHIGVALKIIDKILAENKTALESLYKITVEDESVYDVLKLIGKQCNFIQKKGEVDETRTATRIINDWQIGLLRI